MTEENEGIVTEKNIEDYKLLKEMLHSQKKEFDLLAKKKADGQLNTMKIKMVNRVLEPLKELFKNEESYKFLDTLNEDELPTNSDVVLIFSQYETAINEFKNKYYQKDEYLSSEWETKWRWMTKEFPPNYYENYYENIGNDDDYEDDE
ncbi:MAG: hypothetical protein U9N83_02590 [Thermodesulfobacteriota bacterium]|nr:hypothetical protein [Thermodesulfobacteriota bacterium]